jgi:hypothetical protein
MIDFAAEFRSGNFAIHSLQGEQLGTNMFMMAAHR